MGIQAIKPATHFRRFHHAIRKSFHQFNPFRDLHADLKGTVSGPAQGIGATDAWESTGGDGSQTIVSAQSGRTDWPSLALLYEGLMRVAPSVGTAVARAVAVGHSGSPQQGLAALAAELGTDQKRFQPAWVARAHLHFSG